MSLEPRRWFRPRIAALVIPSAALIGVVFAVLVYDSGPHDPTGRKSGRALASGLMTFSRTASEVRAPFPCAELFAASGAGDQVMARLGNRTITRNGHTATIAADPEITLGVIADTRGATDRTLAQLGEIRAAFSDAGVDLVISLGGIADTEAELRSIYAALAGDAPWPVLAIPGNREPVLAHRRTIVDLNESNRGVVLDGSDVRLLRIGPATIATFPGVSESAQLVSGDRGCVHSSDDAEAIAQLLRTQDTIKIWAGYAPPRQLGATGSDVARGGIHVGERILTGPIQRSEAALVLHGLVDEAALRAQSGDVSTKETAFVAAGSAAASPIIGAHTRALRGSAVIITIDKSRIRWRRLAIDLAPGN